MITKVYATEDGRKFASKVKAVQHQRRIEAMHQLKNLLLGAPLIEQTETMDVAFEDQFVEWLLSEPIRIAFLDISSMVEQDVPQLDRTPEGRLRRDGQRVGEAPSAATQADFRTTEE